MKFTLSLEVFNLMAVWLWRWIFGTSNDLVFRGDSSVGCFTGAVIVAISRTPLRPVNAASLFYTKGSIQKKNHNIWTNRPAFYPA